MTDLKEKLRTSNLLSQRNQRALQNEAADRIEKLEAALREIADHSPGVTHGWAEHVRHIARAALSP